MTNGCYKTSFLRFSEDFSANGTYGEFYSKKIYQGHLEGVTFIGGEYIIYMYILYKEADEGIERTCGSEDMELAGNFMGTAKNY